MDGLVQKVFFEKHRNRSDFKKPGVYLLVGEDNSTFGKRLYIGEGDPVIPRLEDHFRKKEWWKEVIVFSAKDQTINKAFVQCFKAQLIQLARKVGRYRIENSNSPVVPTLSEPEKAICESYLREILLCLPLLGVNFEPNLMTENKKDATLFIRAKGLVAQGFEISEGFVVSANSEVAGDETKSLPEPIRRLRNNLRAQGIIRDDGTGKLTFAVEHRFGSPSTASSVILGSSSNGRDVWKNSSGKSLKSIQSSFC